MHIIFIKLVSQMEHYLDYMVPIQETSISSIFPLPESFYRKTIPIIKISPSSVYSKTMQINNLFFASSHTVWFNVVYSILIS